MDYQKIHDDIIRRAQTRSDKIPFEHHVHHITPMCEGGQPDGPTAILTVKEHATIHALRYRMNQILGNKLAYTILKYGFYNAKERNYSTLAKLSHIKFKERDPIGYVERQRKAGIAAGLNSLTNSLGLFALSEADKQKARDKGRATIVLNKIGMFSDEYRAQHRLTLQKSISTPDGQFDSMQEAAKHYGVVPGTITYRVNQKSPKWKDWSYTHEGENNNE
mgnify:CR=1 FL=1